MRSIRPVTAILIAGLVLAACATDPPPSTSAPGTTSPTAPEATATAIPPTAAPSQTPSPRPSAVDASAAFTDTLSSPTFQSRVTVAGFADVSGVKVPIEGLLEVRPGASHTVLTLIGPNGPDTTETIVYAGHTYKLSEGAWFDEGAVVPGADLGSAISDLGGFVDS
ncbi:MAG TPA: hypothetical protein VM243_16325, partial [Phycisphaerae bacterium]|nr:hypothetical protein [Phycisphaerae bacterium]